MYILLSICIFILISSLQRKERLLFFSPCRCDSEGSFYLHKSSAAAQNSTFHWHGVHTSIPQSKVGFEFYLCGNNVHYSLKCENKRTVKIGWYCPCQDVIFMLLVIMDIL